ncbi:type I-F CRISPR-associated endoribonuclease Cas6/Csy4 [Cedecea colo]|uniref:Type I-F CRISPR-associated endoribonuclease Cas6/Csy4 n=1 Tax=Cedecea colo TaxID=2552946 RepID=A0ABX0VK94_9ENTR|nr:type I-F CRISPR-associated endoribonuclease Cas6/Csy4 [Cedecea colo]NIY47472.1 type I-F CRISPR-associated endoribonuclease Cas6/Csy4 [Cedecea colo]
MDSYQDIRVLPDPEFQESMLMAALFAKLHRALGGRKKGDIGVSFPEHNRSPGGVLRLHGKQTALKELEATGWRAGLNDYCTASSVLPVPAIKGWRKVTRVQVKSSPERLLRRSVRKGWITEEEAQHRLSAMQEKRSKLPFIQLKSLSNGQAFRLFIHHSDLQEQQISGNFSNYGFSDGATIPWF